MEWVIRLGADEGDVLGVGSEDVVREGEREAGGEGVGAVGRGGGGEVGEAGAGAGGWGAAFEDEVVVAVERGGGFAVDGLAGEEQGGDVAVGVEVVRVLRLVADVSLGFCVRGRRSGHVFPLPGDLVGADEHEAVDFGFELEGQGEKTAGVDGIAFGRGAGFVGVAGCVDDKA